MGAIPGDFSLIQQPSVQFNNPVSEASLTAIGGSINGLLSILMPVGTIVHTMLDEATFQAQLGSPSPATFVLADGRNVAGSEYQIVTGNVTIPDLRGYYLRGKDYGTGNDTHGNLPVGSLEADQFKSHNHNFSDPGHSHTTTYQGTGLTPFLRSSAYGSGSSVSGTDATGSNPIVTNASTTGITFVAQGGNETNPRTVVVNLLIRIN